MLNFDPTPQLEKELKNLQGALAEAYKGLESASKHERDYLNRCALISTVGASTRIENAVLTDVEIEWVDTALSQDGKTTRFEEQKSFILNKLSKDRERSIDEVVGCREVLTIVFQQAHELMPLTEPTIRGLHHQLLQHYSKARHYSGQYKKITNQVISTNHETGEKRIVLNPAEPGTLTDTAMHDLITWYNPAISNAPWPLLVAVEFVFRFLAIHPFQDGNGRLGRALFLLALLQSKDKYLISLIPSLSMDRHIEQNKSRYYSVLHQGSNGQFHQNPKKYHYEPIAWFFLEVLKKALEDVPFYRKRYADYQSLSETAVKVLKLFKASPEKRLRIGDFENQTNIPRRTLQYSLKTLVGDGFISKLGKGAGHRYQLVF